MKGSFHSPSGLVYALYRILMEVRPQCGFLYLLAAAVMMVAIMRSSSVRLRILAFSTAVAVVGQLLFASVGQLCRYEAYLTSFGALVLVGAVAGRRIGRSWPCIMLYGVLSILSVVFATRCGSSFLETVRASSDIRHQQVVMTRLMAGLPDEARGCVALNDLGYMALHGGFPLVDLWGLGNQDVLELLLKHPGFCLRSDYEQLFASHKVKYAVLFEKWYPPEVMPEGTIDVARLTLDNNTICGADTVIFRATSPEAADRLESHLKSFVNRMPPRARLSLCR